MAVTAKWRRHIDAWKSSGLSQSEYCEQHGINLRTFAARLSDFRKRSMAESVALVPVQIESNSPAAMTPPAVTVMVFTHAQGHRLELPSSVPASWVAELFRCLA